MENVLEHKKPREKGIGEIYRALTFCDGAPKYRIKFFQGKNPFIEGFMRKEKEFLFREKPTKHL